MATWVEDGQASDSKFISKDSSTLGGPGISTHSTMLLNLLGTVNSLTSDNHDQVGFGGRGLGWRDFLWVCHRS